MAQQIGQLVTLETKTALPQHFDMSRMDDLMIRSELTVSECDELRSLALAMPIENVPVETHELAKQLQFIEATLPSKNTDEQRGQMRTAVYARILGGYTKEALSYMTERVCKELDWFPTPRQCLEILEGYTPRTTKKDKALRICLNNTEARFEEFIMSLRCGEPVELSAKPERWLRIAEERGYLRRVDGEFTVR